MKQTTTAYHETLFAFPRCVGLNGRAQVFQNKSSWLINLNEKQQTAMTNVLKDQIVIYRMNTLH